MSQHLAKDKRTMLLDNKIGVQVERVTEQKEQIPTVGRERIPDNRMTEHPQVKTNENSNMDNRMVSHSVPIDLDVLLDGKPFQSKKFTPLRKEPKDFNQGKNTFFNYQRGNYQFNPESRNESILDDVGHRFQLSRTQEAVQDRPRTMREFRRQR